jgi:hypothetical protein
MLYTEAVALSRRDQQGAATLNDFEQVTPSLVLP